MNEFIRRNPRLYHLSSGTGWEGIQKFGLLCTNEIMSRCGQVSDAQKLAVYQARRTDGLTLVTDEGDSFLIRDQKPLCGSGLKTALQGRMSPVDWINSINGRVFFWIRHQDADAFSRAKSYRSTNRILIELDTRSLLGEYGLKAAVTTFNVGYTMRKPKFRSSESFVRLDSYRGSDATVRELTILGNLENAVEHVCRATLIESSGNIVELFARR